jgi:hypothetical protein
MASEFSSILGSTMCMIQMILSLGSSMSKRRRLEEGSRPFVFMKLDYIGTQTWMDID